MTMNYFVDGSKNWIRPITLSRRTLIHTPQRETVRFSKREKEQDYNKATCSCHGATLFEGNDLIYFNGI